MFVCSHEATEIQALCETIAVIRSGRLGLHGTVSTLPDPVFKVTGASPRDAGLLLDRLQVLSSSSAGSALYVALKERMTLGEVREAIRVDDCDMDVQEVHAFDERILAFLQVLPGSAPVSGSRRHLWGGTSPARALT